MSRVSPRTVIGALGLAGALSVAAPAFADAPALRGVSCVQAGWAPDRASCRAAIHRRAMRSDAARVQRYFAEATAPFTGRYVSLLILGVGY